jgi:ferredoxin
MAEKDNAWEDNVPGKWYVDKNCILCGVCVDVAGENFKESDAGDHAYVSKQPASDEEIAACKDAMDQCPVEAIGEDGE